MSDFFTHPQALIDDGAIIGRNTRVWAFSHILSGASLGEDCNICDHTFIESDVVMGNRVTVKCGVYLWNGLYIEDDVCIGPSAVFTNDMLPRSKCFGPDGLKRTYLRHGCSIGASATLLPGVEVGAYALIAAASVVTKSVPAHALVMGSPARIKSWVCRCARKLHFIDGHASCCGHEYFLMNNEVRVKNGA